MSQTQLWSWEDANLRSNQYWPSKGARYFPTKWGVKQNTWYFHHRLAKLRTKSPGSWRLVWFCWCFAWLGNCLLGKQQSLQFCPLKNSGDLEHILRIRLYIYIYIYTTHHRIMTDDYQHGNIRVSIMPGCYHSYWEVSKPCFHKHLGEYWHAWTTGASCEMTLCLSKQENSKQWYWLMGQTPTPIGTPKHCSYSFLRWDVN